MGIVSTIPEKCRRCYTCVRECPAKAIKVEAGQAMVIEERCIACGNCVKVCAQKAKQIADSTAAVRDMLKRGEKVFACLAPSFPAAFWPVEPGKIIAGLRELGFSEVWEVAFGAELVSVAYGKLFNEAAKSGKAVITTPCPALVGYVEKYMPALCGALAPIVSPMIAVARAVRHRHGESVRVVFIGPCIAKKSEMNDPSVKGAVDAVLTYEELDRMFREDGVEPSGLAPSGFDGPRSLIGRSFPISGGLLRTAGLSTDILENDVIITEGKERVIGALREMVGGTSRARFYDILFCEGCINGPKMLNELSVFARKEVVAEFVNAQSRHTTQRELAESLAEFADLDLSRSFAPQDMSLPQPGEEKIARTLRAMKKLKPEDQLNCGACGYASCREKAIAVCQGLAEVEMCLPFLVEELGETIKQLKLSHEELTSAQQRLVQSERLASMGQLSAGVAHEINNPLGTILLYAHVLLKNLREGDPKRSDLAMILGEATRCKDIVRGLLDFARQSRVSKLPADMARLVEDVRTATRPRAEAAGVTVLTDVEAGMPKVLLDGAQVKQALVNLVDNGIDASKPGGEVRVSARLDGGGKLLELAVADDGCGIAKENLGRLFTPFFTTKEMGKGTGLGLAITYGVVKMHSGDITVDSTEGAGTTFRIKLPVSGGGAD